MITVEKCDIQEKNKVKKNKSKIKLEDHLHLVNRDSQIDHHKKTAYQINKY